MTCASCGRRVATGARYCVHCGAEQSVPTPIALAESIARRGGREAANAADAESTATVAPIARLPGRTPAERARERPPLNDEPRAANSDQPGRPAYADAPSLRGAAIALIASVAVVAIAVAAYAAWKIESPHGDVATDESLSAAAAPLPSALPPTGAASSASTEPATPATQAAADTSESGAAPQSAAPPADATTPVEIRPLPPHPAASRPHVAQATKPAAPAATAKTAEPSPTQTDAAPAPVTRTHVAAVSPTAAARSVDRWQRLDEEIAQCTRADFITRVICSQRARFRYCSGYWGKVPQCPGSPATNDRGQ